GQIARAIPTRPPAQPLDVGSSIASFCSGNTLWLVPRFNRNPADQTGGRVASKRHPRFLPAALAWLQSCVVAKWYYDGWWNSSLVYHQTLGSFIGQGCEVSPILSRGTI